MTTKKIPKSAAEVGVRREAFQRDASILGDKEQEELKQFKETHETRKWLINLLQVLSVAWLMVTLIVVYHQGFREYGEYGCWSLSDPVMIAFLTNALGTVLGLWYVGLRHYFPRNDKPR